MARRPVMSVVTSFLARPGLRTFWLIMFFSSILAWLQLSRKQRNPQPVTQSAPESQLYERLKTLHEVANELTKAATFDDLCRQAIELGRSRLGFDRLGLWFWDQASGITSGSFGTDESGQTRDERTLRGEIDKDELIQIAIRDKLSLVYDANVPLYNHQLEVVGRGWNAMAVLWDGGEITGWISADNLLRHQPVTTADLEILKLYGTTLGHLCTRKRIEEDLLHERNLLRTIVETTQDRVFIKDTESRFILSNRTSWSNKPHVKQESDVLGKNDYEYFPGELAARYRQDDQEVFRTGKPLLNREEPSISKDGKPVILLTSKIPIRDTQGNVTGLVGISRDITERKHAEQQQLELALQREKVQLLNEFIGNVSHDLKTPLTTIRNSIYLIEHLNDPERERARLQIIKEQTDILDRHIQHILAMSRLDHSPELVQEPVNLNDLVVEVEKKLQPIAEKKNQRTILKLDNTLPTIMGSHDELYRVVINLMENALNYTPESGSVSVKTNTQNGAALLEFFDTGIGIDEKDLPHIFERFYRSADARALVSGGTGLGLSIVKKIVELHSGQIEVESSPGKGTCFRVRLPFNRSA